MKHDKIKSLSKQTAIDHIINSVKALSSVFPFGGGAIASLINDYIPKSRERKTIEFLSKVAEDLEVLKEKVNSEYIVSEEFEYLFQKAWRVAVEHYQEEKIDGFRAILLNAAIGKEATGDERDLFINILNDLTGYHFQMLKLLKNPVEWNENNNNRVTVERVTTSLGYILKTCLPEWGEEKIVIIIDGLYHKKLCTISSDQINTMLSGGGIEILNNALTPFGKKFIDYVTIG